MNKKCCPNHPGRPAYTKGLCHYCYDKDLRAKKRAENPEKVRNYFHGYYVENSEKIKETSSARYTKCRAENPEKLREAQRRRHLKRMYGISPEEFDAMLSVQNNSCAICGLEFTNTEKSNSPCVDHCHETGLVRGLLCDNCNVALGRVKDSIPTLYRALSYLTKKRKKWPVQKNQ